MDPDANLKEQRRLIKSMRDDMDTGSLPNEIDVDRFYADLLEGNCQPPPMPVSQGSCPNRRRTTVPKRPR